MKKSVFALFVGIILVVSLSGVVSGINDGVNSALAEGGDGENIIDDIIDLINDITDWIDNIIDGGDEDKGTITECTCESDADCPPNSVGQDELGYPVEVTYTCDNRKCVGKQVEDEESEEGDKKDENNDCGKCDEKPGGKCGNGRCYYPEDVCQANQCSSVGVALGVIINCKTCNPEDECVYVPNLYYSRCCAPERTCESLGRECGAIDDACRDKHTNCGTCPSDKTCSNGQCV